MLCNMLSTNASPTLSPSLTLKKVWKVEADGRYSVSRQKFAESARIALRTLGGEGIVETDGGTVRAAEGSILFFKASAIRRYCTARDHWHFFWFEYESDLQGIPYGDPADIPPLPWEKLQLEECMKFMYSEKTAALASSLFCSLLLYYLDSFHNSENFNFQKHIAERSVQYIRSNLNKNITVCELARYNNISERYLHSIFTAELGVAPKNYILSAKLRHAAELLRMTDLKLQAIAMSLGFENQYYFSKIFKKYCGIGPAAYRRQFSVQ